MTSQITSFTSPPEPVPTHSQILRNDRDVLAKKGLHPYYNTRERGNRISLQRDSRQEPMHMGGESKNRSSSPTQSYPEPSDSDDEVDDNLVGYYKVWNGKEWLLRRTSPFTREMERLELELATIDKEKYESEAEYRAKYKFYSGICATNPTNDGKEMECIFRVKAYCSRCQKPNPDFPEYDCHWPGFQEFNRFGPRDTESWHIVCNECLKKPFNYEEWKKGRWKYVPLK